MLRGECLRRAPGPVARRGGRNSATRGAVLRKCVIVPLRILRVYSGCCIAVNGTASVRVHPHRHDQVPDRVDVSLNELGELNLLIIHISHCRVIEFYFMITLFSSNDRLCKRSKIEWLRFLQNGWLKINHITLRGFPFPCYILCIY